MTLSDVQLPDPHAKPRAAGPSNARHVGRRRTEKPPAPPSNPREPSPPGAKPAADSAPLLDVQNVSFAYEGQTVIHSLAFAVKAGDYLCVVGENGSGKSTLIKGILGLKTPAAGRIQKRFRPAELGYLPQQTPAQKDFPGTVYEIVRSGCLNARGPRLFYGPEDRRTALTQLSRLEIPDLKNRCYRELSGGQQQRVLLARALCAAKKLLLLDEPVSGLDPLVTKALYRIIGQLNRETGLTVIMVSHDVRNALRHARKILHLNKAQAFFGSAADYRQSPLAKGFWEGDENHA